MYIDDPSVENDRYVGASNRLFVVSDDEIEEYDEWDAFFSTNPPMIVIEPHKYEPVTLDLLEHEMVHFLSRLELDGIDENHKLQRYPHGTIAG